MIGLDVCIALPCLPLKQLNGLARPTQSIAYVAVMCSAFRCAASVLFAMVCFAVCLLVALSFAVRWAPWLRFGLSSQWRWETLKFVRVHVYTYVSMCTHAWTLAHVYTRYTSIYVCVPTCVYKRVYALLCLSCVCLAGTMRLPCYLPCLIPWPLRIKCLLCITRLAQYKRWPSKRTQKSD